MNTVYLATITKGGNVAFQFVAGTEMDRANYLAGEVMDRLCDYHGGDDWYYEVEPLPYFGGMMAPSELVKHALSKVAI